VNGRSATKRTMVRALFLMQLPPPIHGVSVMNRRIVADARIVRDFDVEVVRLAFASDLADINRVSARKIARWMALLATLAAKLAARRPAFVYFTPVVTGAGYLRDLAFIAIVKAFRVPLILHVHGRGIAERAANPLWRACYRFGLRGAAIVSASDGMRARDVEPLAPAPSRSYTVANCVDTVDVERFRAVKALGTPTLLFLSATFAFKGVDVLLRAAEILRERRTAFRLEIVGQSTPERDREIRASIDSRGLSRCVVCLGGLYDDAKFAALGRADVFVHPTLNDYFPLVVLEAMQFALPVVATRVGAIPEMIEHRTEGLIVEPADPNGLAEALEALLRDANLRRTMGAAARARFLQRYTQERFSRALWTVLETEGFGRSAA